MRMPQNANAAALGGRNVAPSRKGRARIEQILAAARDVLIEKDYTQFSLRNIAAAAGIHLSNLQYYFRSKEDVIHALVDYIVQQYDAKYRERFETLPTMPYPRFIAMLDYLIEDIHDPQTRRLFVQLWALLESSDATGNGTLLNELYAQHIENIAEYIRNSTQLCPPARGSSGQP